jgi:transcriptional regulator with XRE-family HTH domain
LQRLVNRDDAPVTQHATDVRDSMREMSKRTASIPVAPWWYEAVKREMDARGIRQTDLAELVHESKENVSRCVNGKTHSIRLVLTISRALGIPRPIFLPSSEADALKLHGALALRSVDEEISELERSVGNPGGRRPEREGANESTQRPRKDRKNPG